MSPYSPYWYLRPTIFQGNPEFIFDIWALNCGQYLTRRDASPIEGRGGSGVWEEVFGFRVANLAGSRLLLVFRGLFWTVSVDF
jgi:hypothetical protein